MSETRNIDDAYLKARIATYKTYRKAGLSEQAEQVAQALKARHDFDVADLDDERPEPAPEERAEAPLSEKATADPMPEAAVEPKPQPASPEAKPTAAKKTPAKRTPAKPAEGK